MYKSETSKIYHLIEDYFNESLKVCDIGFGGHKVVEYADGIDLPTPYAHTGDHKVDIPCDVSKGIPVDDNVYDIVYSSHLIEDFEDTNEILTEFIRILKNKGKLMLVFPDQPTYALTCKLTGQPFNTAHKIHNMGYHYMIKRLDELPVDYKMLLSSDRDIDYNVVMVLEVEKK